MSGAVVITQDVAEAAEYIGASWRQGVESIIETGRRLIEIRERFKDDRGKWSLLTGRDGSDPLLPFGVRHSYRLIHIAKSDRLLAHVPTLPSDTFTLEKLTQLSDDRFTALIEDGSIHPGMKRNEASAETAH